MAEHIGTQLIKTERLILRRALMQDAVDMFQNWANDPQVTKYLTWPPHKELQVTKNIIKQWIQNYDAPDYYQWMIVPKDSNAPIGSVSVVRYDSDSDTAEIGYCIGKKWWNQGFTTEALQAVIRYLFEKAKISSIEARHDINNPASGAVMRKCGMTLQEIAPNTGRNNQGICDLAVYTIQNRNQSLHTREIGVWKR